MGWDQPPEEAGQAPASAEVSAGQEEPVRREDQPNTEQREAMQEQIDERVQDNIVECRGSEEVPITDVSYTEQEKPLEMNAAGEMEAREELGESQAPP
jgi:hypothetical protein